MKLPTLRRPARGLAIAKHKDRTYYFGRDGTPESEVAEMVSQGKPGRQIAAESGIGLKTIDFYRCGLVIKTRATDVRQMVRMWRAWRELDV